MTTNLDCGTRHILRRLLQEGSGGARETFASRYIIIAGWAKKVQVKDEPGSGGSDNKQQRTTRVAYCRL